jgi:hypothetical protein
LERIFKREIAVPRLFLGRFPTQTNRDYNSKTREIFSFNREFQSQSYRMKFPVRVRLAAGTPTACSASVGQATVIRDHPGAICDLRGPLQEIRARSVQSQQSNQSHGEADAYISITPGLSQPRFCPTLREQK